MRTRAAVVCAWHGAGVVVGAIAVAGVLIQAHGELLYLCAVPIARRRREKKKAEVEEE